jgi:hypothetical protein
MFHPAAGPDRRLVDAGLDKAQARGRPGAESERTPGLILADAISLCLQLELK